MAPPRCSGWRREAERRKGLAASSDTLLALVDVVNVRSAISTEAGQLTRYTEYLSLTKPASEEEVFCFVIQELAEIVERSRVAPSKAYERDQALDAEAPQEHD
ncbi:MAG: hypothetical protein M3294_02875 [Pseudomonadota bacterium]|nr:hypothetical protein [Pseudomonadota bacterium]